MTDRRTLLAAVTLVVVGASALALLPRLREQPKPVELPAYYPTSGWRSAKPAEVGLNPDPLARMVADIKSSPTKTKSCLVVKGGYLAVEEYFQGYTREDKLSQYSCTKTVVGTLIGIAVAEGRIKGVEEKLPGLLPGREMEPWMREITLENLLTMSAGLPGDDWLYDFAGLDEMLAAPDPLAYALSRPRVFEPGSRFEYTDAVSHILSCVITEKTGVSAAEYAELKLFRPLGITEYTWASDAQGRSWGYSRLMLRSVDMAKIGLLYLHGGEWEGKQVVPASWIREATRHRVDANLLDGYGDQIWVDEDGWYTALGYMGQFIMVFPQHDIVAVFTGGTPETYNYNIQLADRYIIPAAASGRASTS